MEEVNGAGPASKSHGLVNKCEEEITRMDVETIKALITEVVEAMEEGGFQKPPGCSSGLMYEGNLYLDAL